MSDAPTERYGMVKISKLRAAVNELREACREEGNPRIQKAWDRAEPWLDRIFTNPNKG